ncbi:MAG: class I SAM-dependent methyltransferase [Oscillospiraceae bacterium]
MDYIIKNAEAWDKNVENKNTWTVPVSSNEVENARKGIWNVLLTPNKPVPKSWFPNDLTDKKVLLLAGGGGQQGPILSAAGADVTVFDNSAKQLEQDRMVAERDNLSIKTIQGNVQDLSVFADESFDFIMQLVGCWVDSILPVWNEAYRVLKKGGIMISALINPVEFLFDWERQEKGELVVRHKIPYSDLTSLTKDESERITAEGGVAFGHTLHDQIQGQIDSGFLIAGFYEDNGDGTVLDNYIEMYCATKAIKMNICK